MTVLSKLFTERNIWERLRIQNEILPTKYMYIVPLMYSIVPLQSIQSELTKHDDQKFLDLFRQFIVVVVDVSFPLHN